MRFVRAANASDLPIGGRVAALLEGVAVALFNVGGKIYAIEDRCPHELNPLHDGELCGTRLSCRWHGWTFELAERPGDPALPRVEKYSVKVEAGEIYVGLPGEADADARKTCI